MRRYVAGSHLTVTVPQQPISTRRMASDHPPCRSAEPGACDIAQLDCADCRALAPNCTWFVSERDALESHCGNTTTGAAEGYHPLEEDAVCEWGLVPGGDLWSRFGDETGS